MLCYIVYGRRRLGSSAREFNFPLFRVRFPEPAHRLALRAFRQGDVYQLQFDLPAQPVRQSLYVL